MSATATKPRTDHPAEVKAILKRGRLSEGTELSESQVTALLALPDKASEEQIHAVVTGKAEKSATAKKRSAAKYSEGTREVYKRALEITGTPDKGGPKYPLTVKQTAAIEKALASKAKAVAEANGNVAEVSGSALKKIAQGKDAPTGALVAVRDFLNAHQALKDDRTMYARKGAAIILALREVN